MASEMYHLISNQAKTGQAADDFGTSFQIQNGSLTQVRLPSSDNTDTSRLVDLSGAVPVFSRGESSLMSLSLGCKQRPRQARVCLSYRRCCGLRSAVHAPCRTVPAAFILPMHQLFISTETGRPSLVLRTHARRARRRSDGHSHAAALALLAVHAPYPAQRSPYASCPLLWLCGRPAQCTHMHPRHQHCGTPAALIWPRAS